jgi:tricorn protease
MSATGLRWTANDGNVDSGNQIAQGVIMRDRGFTSRVLNGSSGWARGLAWVLAALLSGSIQAQSHPPLLLRDPAVSRTQIAFRYAGNIWIANRDGGNPRRLTNAGPEGKPFFSPDGSQLAFTAEYNGAHGVYVVAASGGVPRRLTYHPGDIDVTGWTPDGRQVLFKSKRAAFTGDVLQLFMVPAAGGAVMPLPIDRAVQGSFSSDAARFAYVPIELQSAWKHYRGGQTTSISIVDLRDSSIQAKIPRQNSNDFNPMWVGDSIYFLSDRNGPMTLFAYDVTSRQVRQVVENKGLDLKSAAASSDAIVYEQFGSLHLLDLGSGSDRALDIRPLGNFAEIQPHLLHIDPKRISSASLSPTGAEVLLGVRGEILTVSAATAEVRNLTHTTNVDERDPAWSPDGEHIAYFSDESGDWALHIRGAQGDDRVRKIDLGKPTAVFNAPVWSPDSRKIAFTDTRLNVWYVDLDKGSPVRIDTDTYAGPSNILNPVWSPDSRWIAYTKQLRSHLHALFLYSSELRQSYQITDGISDALYPAFDQSGRYLYFTASTNVALTTGWADISGLQHPVTRSVYAAVLEDGVASPLAPESERDGRTSGPIEMISKIKIDMENIGGRIVALPVPARNYVGLAAGKAGIIYLLDGPILNIDFLDSLIGLPVTTVYRFDCATQGTQRVVEDVTSFRLASNAEKMLYSKGGQWVIAPVQEGPDDAARPGTALRLDSLRIQVDPRAEWTHMFHEVWRDERDLFYDPGLHGLDLAKAQQTYAPFLSNISSRDDLNYLFEEMLGNLTISHMAAGGGDMPQLEHIHVGFLGADYSVDHERYRFARIYGGDPWQNPVRPSALPGADVGDSWNARISAPLTQPGSTVRVGEYLLAVNGQEVRPTRDLYAYFEGLAGKALVIKVGDSPDGRAARDVTVIPVEDEITLRNFAWVEDNRRKVDQMTGGRVAYVYLPDTRADGFASFNRYFFAQVGKEAAIIDERYNQGGYQSDYFVDYLRRPRSYYFHARVGTDITVPLEAIFGPKVMIINEMAGSGGDSLPWSFHNAGIGPLIGTRTWGGLVGGYLWNVRLMDGGFATLPNLGFYTPNDGWGVENHGVAPDIAVENDPKSVREGGDPQLETAAREVLKRLQSNPPPTPPQLPPFPDYHGFR